MRKEALDQFKDGRNQERDESSNKEHSDQESEGKSDESSEEDRMVPKRNVLGELDRIKRERAYSVLSPYSLEELDSGEAIVKLYVIKMGGKMITGDSGSSPIRKLEDTKEWFKMNIDLAKCSPETDNDQELRRFKKEVKDRFSLGESFRIYNQQGHAIQDYEMGFLSQDNQGRSVVYVSNSAVSFDFDAYLRLFKEIRKLGEGGFGQVFLAKHQITHEKQAIKIIQPHIHKADEVSKAFKEAQVLQKLDHPNIIKLNNVFQLSDTRIILFMPHLKGGSLNDFLNEQGGKVTETIAQQIMSEVAIAINFCHQKSIVHRDIKLENIMLRKRGDLSQGLVIIDFGIAGQLTRKEKQLDGTIRYAPPELLNGKKLIADTSFDVWSLGILLYRLVSGTFPFDGKNFNEIKQRILVDELGFPSDLFQDVSDSCLALIKLMLNKQALQRPKLQQLILHPWFQSSKHQQKLMNMTMFKNQQNTLTNFFKQEMENISALRTKRLDSSELQIKDEASKDLIVINENVNLDSPLGNPLNRNLGQKSVISKKNHSPSALVRAAQAEIQSQMDPEKFSIVPQVARGNPGGGSGTAGARDHRGRGFIESALSLQVKKQKLNDQRNFKPQFDSISLEREATIQDKRDRQGSNIMIIKKKAKRVDSINHQRNDSQGLNSINQGTVQLKQGVHQRSSVVIHKTNSQASSIIALRDPLYDGHNHLSNNALKLPLSKFRKDTQDTGGSLDKRNRFAIQSLVHRDEVELPQIGSPTKKKAPQLNQIIKRITQEIDDLSPERGSHLNHNKHQTNRGTPLMILGGGGGPYYSKNNQSSIFDSTFEKSTVGRNTSQARVTVAAPPLIKYQTPMIKGQFELLGRLIQDGTNLAEPEITKISEFQPVTMQKKEKSPKLKQFDNVKLKLM